MLVVELEKAHLPNTVIFLFNDLKLLSNPSKITGNEELFQNWFPNFLVSCYHGSHLFCK